MPPRKIRGIDILFEDDDLLVVDKAAGVLTEATRRKEAFTAENALNAYIRKGQPRSSKHVRLVHRLDRETSGALVFAKTDEVCEFLKDVWHDAVEKTYLAIAWGEPSPPSGTLAGYLYEDRDLFVRQLREPPARGGPPVKFAQTDYRTLASRRGMSLVAVKLRTGRRNQIRVQFADAGHPLVGDEKYGPGAKPFRERMCLHALSISFPHPRTGRPLLFEAPVPPVFIRLFGAGAFAGLQRSEALSNQTPSECDRAKSTSLRPFSKCAGTARLPSAHSRRTSSR